MKIGDYLPSRVPKVLHNFSFQWLRKTQKTNWKLYMWGHCYYYVILLDKVNENWKVKLLAPSHTVCNNWRQTHHSPWSFKVLWNMLEFQGKMIGSDLKCLWTRYLSQRINDEKSNILFRLGEEEWSERKNYIFNNHLYYNYYIGF